MFDSILPVAEKCLTNEQPAERTGMNQENPTNKAAQHFALTQNSNLHVFSLFFFF